jgi:hypothetical protein
MENEDKRLFKIRHYKGSIKDLNDFIKDKEAETKAATDSTNSIEPTKE